ncbi:MAG: glycosyltransferase, partial [Phycisphaerales bacterium]|nr:glycosyltransferase [Phycisphaerales bacterium]
MTMPLVSICIPLYNKAARLGTVLESILSQSHQNLEVVVSDNGSDDGSSETVRKFAAGDSRIRWHRIDHTISLNENWRLVMRLAKGAFCKVHSADDPLHPEFIPRMLEPMLGDSGEGGGGGAFVFPVSRGGRRFLEGEAKIGFPSGR